MPFAKLRLRFGTKLFLSHLVAVILVSGSVGTFFYNRALESLMRSLRSRLQNSAALLSYTIDARALDGIRAPADMAQPAYQANLAKLRQLRRLNPDIAFLYIMRLEGEQVVFVIDSDETERQAPPGRVYEESPDSMRMGFHSPAVDDQLYRDEWGVFLSGYAPLRNGEGRYLVGIDMRADEVDQKLAQLRLTGLVSLLASILLALLFAFMLSRGLTRRIAALVGRCRELASGHFEATPQRPTYDEFDDLTKAFDTMALDLQRSRADTDTALGALREARDDLEQRVAVRTRELNEALDQVKVLRGIMPICASCKKIRDDRGYWQQLELFVEQHSDARFSHGLCPSCSFKLYGNLLAEEDDRT
jgi:HAMP domain-containing protein